MNDTAGEPRKRVAIAGASGFVGRALRRSLSGDYELIALTRSLSGAGDQKESSGVTWRQCDLFDVEAIKDALVGVDVVIYLVHSMSPQSRLTQARFEDLDLLLADNMRIACDAAGVQHVLYLGGLTSGMEEKTLSRHLESRHEVGLVLGNGKARMTQLGAGVVIGRGGSSLRMLTRLIRRLPMMVLPRWTANPTQPVSIKDVVRAFEMALRDPETWTGSFDLGINERMTYGDMIMRTAGHLERNPLAFHVPISSPKVSTLWIMLFSGEPRSLVFPLVSSLSSPTVARDNPMLQKLKPDLQGFDEALDEAISVGARDEDPRRVMLQKDRLIINRRSLVRSIQRMKAPEDWTIERVCQDYWRWLGSLAGPVLKVDMELDGGGSIEEVRVRLLGRLDLIVMRRDQARCDERSEVLSIEGGLLVRGGTSNKGRVEFRRIKARSEAVVTVLNDFAPSLPWYLYEFSQAIAHLVIMGAFRRWLAAKIRAAAKADAGA